MTGSPPFDSASDSEFDFGYVEDNEPLDLDDVAMDEWLGETADVRDDVDKIRFTIFEAYGARLSKEYRLMPDGSVDADGGTQLQYGSYEVVSYDTSVGIPAALSRIGSRLEGLPPYAAIVLGVPKDGTLKGEIVTKDRHLRGGTSALTRTLGHFGWPDGPGLLYCDGDSIDGLFEILSELYPPFADVAVLIRPSASASVVDPATGMRLKRGEHVYAVLDDPTRSKDCLMALLRLAWVVGCGKSAGFIKLTKAGSTLNYGPIDVTVGSPERLSYEGAVIVGKGLDTLPRGCVVAGGNGILCAKELIEYADRVAPADQFNERAAEAKNKPDFIELRDKVKAKHRAEHVRAAVARGKVKEKVEAEYDRTFSAAGITVGEWIFRELPSDHVLYRKDGTSFTIEDIQLDPAKYHDCDCADPIEGLEYPSKSCAIIYTDGGKVVIYSLAHGGVFAYFAPIDYSKTSVGDGLRKLFEDHGVEPPEGTDWRDDSGSDEPTTETDDDEEDTEEAATPRLADIPLPDVDWTRPEGLLGEMTEFVLASSPWPNRPLAAASAIATLSPVCGRWLYGPTGSSLGVYIVILARTTVGKNRPLTAVDQMLRAAGLERLSTTGKAFSISALEQMIANHPSVVATVDEIGVSLFNRMANKHSNTHAQDMKGALLELWSRDQFMGPFSNTRRAEQQGLKAKALVTVSRPNLTLFGVSGPKRFWESIPPGSVQDGFLNRFLTFHAAARSEPQEVDEDAAKVPQAIVDGLRNLVPGVGGLLGGVFDVYHLKVLPEQLEGAVRRLKWDDDAIKARAHAFQKQVLHVMDHNPEEADLIGRVYEYAIRLASLHAVSRDGAEARVTMRDLEWGIVASVNAALTLIAGVGRLGNTDYEVRFNTIRDVISEAGEIAQRELLRSILPIASGTFLSKEAADELAATGQLPEDATFELLEPVQPHHIQQLDYAPQTTAKPTNVLSFRKSDDDGEIERKLQAKLESLTEAQLQELAKLVGFDSD